MTPDVLASIAEGMIPLPFTDTRTYVGRSGLRLEVESERESELEVWMLSLWYKEGRQWKFQVGTSRERSSLCMQI